MGIDEGKENPIRLKLRAATLGSKKNFRNEIVTFNGEKFEIRQPTIKARADLRAKCIKMGPAGLMDFDMFGFLVWSVIEYTFVPGTDIKVFESSDYDALASNPTGGFMDQFSEIAETLLNVDVEATKRDLKKKEKNN